jgi:hypothetical protein
MVACPSTKRTRRVRGAVPLDGVLADLVRIRQVLSSLGIGEGIVSYQTSLGRDAAVQTLEEFFETDPRENKMVFYSGHGTSKDGSWEFQDGVLSYRDLCRAWVASTSYEMGSHCLLVNDSCHSGFWVEKLKTDKRKDMRLAIQASCRSDEKAGDTPSFTQLYMDYLA